MTYDKFFSKRNKISIIIIMTIAIVFTFFIGGTLAFLTDYVIAKTYNKELGIDIDVNLSLTERNSGSNKYVAINNSGNYPVFVRIKVFCGSIYTINYSNLSTSNWSENNDGYLYYPYTISTEGSGSTTTSELTISIPKLATPGSADDNFNVVVVYEYTKARYTEAGVAYADWANYNTIVETGGSNE